MAPSKPGVGFSLQNRKYEPLTWSKYYQNFTADFTPPSATVTVNDGLGADIAFTTSTTQLSANWTASSDAESGIKRYLYGIGKTGGATDVVPWTDNGTGTSVTKTRLSLTTSQTYYFTVKAENAAGLQSSPANSNGQMVINPASNIREMTRYSNKEVFLISDQNWRDVLSLAPVTIWTDKDGITHKYPTLIYHQEGLNFDADSVIHFMQQYGAQKVTVVGSTPGELDSLLTAPPPAGAGLTTAQVKRISPADYFSYWQNFQSVVYVKNDYETALLASAYAALIDAPLVIEGGNVAGKTVVCVGAPAGATCNENYSIEQLRQKYVQKTNSDKIILVNPNDLTVGVNAGFWAEKSNDNLQQLFSKTSLAAPFLAAGKQELILSFTANDPAAISDFIKTKVNTLGMAAKYLTIVASPEVIAMSRKIESHIYTALDYEYGNLDNDNPPELAVGRIYGYSSSDVSGCIARSLFYDEIAPKAAPSVYFKGNDSWDFEGMAYAYGGLFASAGYSATAIIGKPAGWPAGLGFSGNPEDWKNKQFILYMGHASYSNVDIGTSGIPYLDNSFIIGNGCDTCIYELSKDGEFLKNNAFHWYDLFCVNAIRKGAIGYIGSAGTAGTISEKEFLFQAYGSHNDIGTAFKETNKPYEEGIALGWYGGPSNIWVLLGDPTVKLATTGKSIIPETEAKSVNEYPDRLEYGLTVKNKYRKITKDAFPGRDVLITSQTFKDGNYEELISGQSPGINLADERTKPTFRFELGPLPQNFNVKEIKIESPGIDSYRIAGSVINQEGADRFLSVYVLDIIVKPEKIIYDNQWRDLDVKVILYKDNGGVAKAAMAINPAEPAAIEISNISVQIPKNTFSEPVVMTVRTVTSSALTPASQKSSLIKPTGMGVEITVDKNVQPKNPLTLSINYTADSVGKVSPSLLAIAHYDSESRVLTPLSTLVDYTKHTLTANINHLSQYQIVAVQASGSESAIGEVYAFPNPARAGIKPTLHIETSLAEKVELRIYDIAGDLVHETTISGAPQMVDDGQGPESAYEYVWDTSSIGSGVYVYVVKVFKGSQGSFTAKGKLAVLK